MIRSSECMKQPGISSKCRNRGMSTYMKSNIRQKFPYLSLSRQSKSRCLAYGKCPSPESIIVKIKFIKSYKNLFV